MEMIKMIEKMFNSQSKNIIHKALDGTWQRNQLLSENIANVDTPNYKRKDVTFEQSLKRAIRNNKTTTRDLETMSFRTITDQPGLSYRKDGNNVNIETEMVYLAENQLKYNTLIGLSGYDRIKSVLN
jgi:flagellar basal-body rod protein FlgB